MARKILVLVLIAALALGLFSGCGSTAKDIADNVMEAARAELEKQVTAAVEKYKMDVVEVKTSIGKLNDSTKFQFFCAVLVRSNSDSVPRSCADTLEKIFEEAGLMVQTGSKVESPLLVHKDLKFKHTDFDSGNYYTIYAYQSKIDIDLNLPTLGR